HARLRQRGAAEAVDRHAVAELRRHPGSLRGRLHIDRLTRRAPPPGLPVPRPVLPLAAGEPQAPGPGHEPGPVRVCARRQDLSAEPDRGTGTPRTAHRHSRSGHRPVWLGFDGRNHADPALRRHVLGVQPGARRRGAEPRRHGLVSPAPPHDRLRRGGGGERQPGAGRPRRPCHAWARPAGHASHPRLRRGAGRAERAERRDDSRQPVGYPSGESLVARPPPDVRPQRPERCVSPERLRRPARAVPPPVAGHARSSSVVGELIATRDSRTADSPRRTGLASIWQGAPAFMEAETRYAKSGNVYIAYRVFGNGPRDVILVPGTVSHVELYWDLPANEYLLKRLTAFSRVIVFDKRGQGLSDRVADQTLEERVGDVLAVMDAAGSDRATVYGWSEGGQLSLTLAATYPDRVSGLVLYGTYASIKAAPWAVSREQLAQFLATIETHWGEGVLVRLNAPRRVEDKAFVQWFGRLERAVASPSAILALMRANYEIDVSHLLPSIRVPTLILHREGDALVPVETGRYLA